MVAPYFRDPYLAPPDPLLSPTQAVGTTPQDHWRNIEMQFKQQGFQAWNCKPNSSVRHVIIGLWIAELPYEFPNSNGGTWIVHNGDYIMKDPESGEVRPVSQLDYQLHWTAVGGQPL